MGNWLEINPYRASQRRDTLKIIVESLKNHLEMIHRLLGLKNTMFSSILKYRCWVSIFHSMMIEGLDSSELSNHLRHGHHGLSSKTFQMENQFLPKTQALIEHRRNFNKGPGPSRINSVHQFQCQSLQYESGRYTVR